jgi:Luciferase
VANHADLAVGIGWREMDPATDAGTHQSFADRALEQLRHWPALQVCRAECGMAIGVTADSAQIIHLHQPDEARLWLTRPVIQRLRHALSGNSQIHLEQDGGWIRVRLDSDGDVGLLVTLASLAIQAHTQHAAAPG